MLRIVTHIEHLLLVHDCVIVPKFGGFVLHTKSAMYQAEGHAFYPSRKDVVFNTTLQHNDGLLPESYMQMYAVDYRKAVLMLEEDVNSMKDTLRQHKKLSFGNIGSFTLGEEGQTVFFPSDATLFSLNSYGLSSFYFPTLASCFADEDVFMGEQKRKKDTFYIPISRRWVRGAAASAAAIALFFLISTPVKDVNQSAYTASFVPTEIVSHKVAEAVAPPSMTSEVTLPEKAKTTFVAPAAPALKPSVAKGVKAAPAASVSSETKKPANVAAVVESRTMYHIVIASFPSEDQANQYIASVRSECTNVSKVIRDGKYRIYADKYDNRKQAETYMENLRKNDRFKEAWLYISR